MPDPNLMRDDPLYDTHAHIFTSDIARYPIDPGNPREGPEAVRARVEADPIPLERLLGMWDETGVPSGCGVQYNTVYKTDNSYLLDAAEQAPSRVAPVVMMNSAHPATAEHLDDLIAHRGVVALRVYGFADANGACPWLDSEAALDAWGVVNAHRLSWVMMYGRAGGAEPVIRRVAAMAERFPETAIVLDHCGWPEGELRQSAVAPLREHRNVFLKVTTINFNQFRETGADAARFVREAADMFGVERLMWGSDVGNTQWTYAEMAAQARASAALLNAEERRAYLFGTGHRLFARRDWGE